MAVEIGTAYLPVEGDFGPLNKAVAALGPKLNTKLGKVGKVAGVGLGAAVVGGFAAGKFLHDIGAEFDEAFDKIRVGTGKTGKPLKALQRDFKAVVSGVPAEFGEASTAVADLNSRLGLTGKPLRRLSRQMLELSRITETDVGENVKASTRAFADWEVGTKNQGKALDFLFRASQTSGASVGELSELVVQFGAPLRQVGFDLEEAASMFALFEKSGVNIQTMMPGLKMALKNFFLEDRDPEKALAKTFEGIEKGTISTSKALEIFGQRAGADMVEAVKQGRFEFEDFTQTIARGNDTIMKAGRETRDLPEHWRVFKNRMMVILEPLASKVFGRLGDSMERVGDILTDKRLTRDEKFSQISDMLVDAIGDALPGMAEKAGQGGTLIAKGLAKGMMGATPLSRLIIGAGLIRLLGGRGAILASGVSVGKLLGTGIGAGAGSSALASTAASGLAGAVGSGGGAAGARWLGTEGSKSAFMRAQGFTLPMSEKAALAAQGGVFGGIAGNAAGKKFGGGFMSSLKKVRWARVGGVGLGLALADNVLTEFERRSRERSGDLLTELQAQIDGTKLGVGPLSVNLHKGDGSFFDPFGVLGDNAEEKRLKNVKAQYDEMLTKRVRLSQATIQGLSAQAHEVSLTKEARKQLDQMFRVARTGRKLGIAVDLGMDPKKLHQIQGGFTFLKRGIGTNMADINRVTKRTGRLIATTFGKDTKEGRQLAARNMRATAAAIEQQMDRSGKETKKGMARVRDLIRNANLIAPSRQQAQGFGREWAKAMEGSKKETRKGIADMIQEARKMPGPMRQVALQAWLEQAKQAKRSGDITTGEFRKMRSRVLSEFGSIKKGVGRDGKELADGVIGNVDRLVNTTGDALQILHENMSAALDSVGVKAQDFTVRTTSGGKRGRAQEKQQGGFIVPGSGSGDRPGFWGELGAFVLNREATSAYGFNKGGRIVPLALEPGERYFPPHEVRAMGGAGVLEGMNKAVPRFQKGGEIGGKPVIEGPPGPLRDLGRGAVDKIYKAAQDYIDKHQPKPGVGVAAFGPKGIGSYMGVAMANWVIESLQHAASKGAAPQPTSGYRSHAQNVAEGRNYKSEHEGTQYPYGAVDFGGYTTGLAAKMSVVNATRGFKYPLLAPIGFEDDGHASGTGHQLGGLVKVLQHLVEGGAVADWDKLAGSSWDNNELATLAHVAGMSSPGRMAQKAQGESSGNRKAVGQDPGGTEGLGLWQITTSFNDALIAKLGGRNAMFHPYLNARAAKEIQGEQGMGAWYAPFVGPLGKVQASLAERMHGLVGGGGAEMSEGQKKAAEGKRRKANYESLLRKMRQRVAAAKSDPAKASALWRLISTWGRVGIFDKDERSHILESVQRASSKVEPGNAVPILFNLAQFADKAGEVTGREPDDWHSLTDAIEDARKRGQAQREKAVKRQERKRTRKQNKISSAIARRAEMVDVVEQLAGMRRSTDAADEEAGQLVTLEPEDLTDGYVQREGSAYGSVLDRMSGWRNSLIRAEQTAGLRMDLFSQQIHNIQALSPNPHAPPKQRQQERARFEKQKWRLPALREGLKTLEALRDDTFPGELDELQGNFGGKSILDRLPREAVAGVFGGRIFDIQNTIKELGIKAPGGDDDESDLERRRIDIDWQKRFLVGELQRNTIKGWDELTASLPKFHGGGTVMGSPHQEVPVMALGEERIRTPEQEIEMAKDIRGLTGEPTIEIHFYEGQRTAKVIYDGEELDAHIKRVVGSAPGAGRTTPGGARI